MNKDKNGKVIRDSQFYSEIAKKPRKSYPFQNPDVQVRATQGKRKYWERKKNGSRETMPKVPQTN